MSESKYSTRKPNDNIENGVAYARGGKQKSGGAGADDELPLNHRSGRSNEAGIHACNKDGQHMAG